MLLDAKLGVEGRIATGVRLTDLTLDEADDTLYVADDQGQIHLLALPTGFERATWAGAAPMALDVQNRRLYVNGADGVQALDLTSGQIMASFPQRGAPAPALHEDLVYIADRGVTVYDRDGRKLGELTDTFPQTPGFSPNPYAFGVDANPVTGALIVILNNGVPGSNNASYPVLYPDRAAKPLSLPAPHSFVEGLVLDPRGGDFYLSYSAVRGQEMIHRLAADGRELARLGGRTGLLALDARNNTLYAIQDGVISGLDAETLALLGTWQGPAALSRSRSTHPCASFMLSLLTAPVWWSCRSKDCAPLIRGRSRSACCRAISRWILWRCPMMGRVDAGSSLQSMELCIVHAM